MRFCKSVFLSLVSLTLLSLNAMDQESLDESFLEAAGAGRLGETEALLRQGANINATYRDGTTPLMLAAMYKKPEIIKLLLQQKDPKVNINAINEMEITALIFAATQRGNSESVRLLLQQKDQEVNINATDKDKRTALMYAAGWGGSESVKLLLAQNQKININATDKDEETALMFATSSENYKSVKLLLNAINKDFRDPKELDQHPKLIKLIQKSIDKALEKTNIRRIDETPESLKRSTLNRIQKIIEMLNAFQLFTDRYPEEFPKRVREIDLRKAFLAAKSFQYQRDLEATIDDEGHKVLSAATETVDAKGKKTTKDYMGDKSTFDKIVDYLRKIR